MLAPLEGAGGYMFDLKAYPPVYQVRPLEETRGMLGTQPRGFLARKLDPFSMPRGCPEWAFATI